MKILGLDLAGSEKRNTGYCILGNKNAEFGVVRTEKKIIGIVKKEAPDVVAIDAPLSLPKGRRNIEKRSDNHFRECDRMLMERKIKFFPITLGPMRMLTKRGMEIKKKIEKMDKKIKVIEVFPGAAYDVFGVKRKDKKEIIGWARRFGINARKAKTQDELDAIACAITGLLYARGNCEELKGKDGTIVIPKI